MATFRNKRKLAAVSRETPESTRSGRAPNVLDPELTQEYIPQVSEEIEGRVTKKLSKEFSRTESRILGALSKLDEFLLNPQVRTCSVVAPGTSRSSNLENQGTTGDRPSDDPGPEVECSSPLSGAETDPHTSIFPYQVQSNLMKLTVRRAKYFASIDTSLISSGTVLYSADFSWIQDHTFKFNFNFFRNISHYLNLSPYC